MKIYYLSPDFIDSLDYVDGDEFEMQIRKHPETQVYTPEQFQIAFNHEHISDLGYIVIDDLRYELLALCEDNEAMKEAINNLFSEE